MKKITTSIILFVIVLTQFTTCFATFVSDINCKSMILMEASTGNVIYEKNSHESLPPASITKIMTMLLVCEAIQRGELSLDTQITASERAKSMGGSTIFLDTNEVMPLEDLLKGIAVASGNDAAVAVAEHMCGSVESFVTLMNKRASELGMKDTNFVNCNGLDAENHHTSAYDIAVMSRELLKHKIILNYTTIWMDTLRNGKFQLANTNKLIKFYQGANGMKTGSTDKAGCCISATAKRDGMQLIAVIMGAPTSKERFAAASELLNYGFANFTVVNVENEDSNACKVPVLYGESDSLNGVLPKNSAILIEKKDQANVKTHLNVPKNIKAPIKKGDAIGELIITLNGETLSKTKLVSDRTVNKKSAADYFVYFIKGFLFK